MKDSDLIFGVLASLDMQEYSFRELSELTAPFGISTTSLRTNLSRMQQKGLLAAVRKNKQAWYTIAAKGRRISGNVALSFRQPDWGDWQQQWWGVLYSIPELKKPDRYRIRRKLAAYRFASLYPGFWIRPCHPAEKIPERLADLPAAPSCRLIRFEPLQALAREEVTHLWNTIEINAEFISTLDLILNRMAKASHLNAEEAFREKMITGDQIIHSLFKDPLLPPAYLPENWQGENLRQAFSKFIRTMHTLARPFWQSIFNRREKP